MKTFLVVAGLGLSLLATTAFADSNHPPMQHAQADHDEGMSIMAHQTGTVYAATAGVLNLIAICELYRRHVNPEEPGPADTMRVDAINAEREAS